MIPFVGVFRGLFLGSVLLWYSNSVWKTMDNYYNQEFKKYLQKEKQERRFPAEEGLCPVAEGAQASCDAPASPGAAEDAGGGGGGASARGSTEGRDVTHSGEWRQRGREQVQSEDSEDDEDTCPVLR